MKKGEVYEGTIETVEFPNKGIVMVEDQKVIVKNGIPGQKVRFRIQKKKKNLIQGQILEVLEPSALEIRLPQCPEFPSCGGCMYQTMDYGEQLRMKEGQVRKLLTPVLQAGWERKTDSLKGTESVEGSRQAHVFEGIRPSPGEFAYRNKMEYSFGDAEKDGPLTLGLHRKNSTYDILNADSCRLVHEDFNRIVRAVGDFFRSKKIPYYHKMRHEGFLRHLLIRRASASGEILVDLVTTSQSGPGYDRISVGLMLEELLVRLLGLPLEGKIVGILHTTNDSLADAVINEHTDILYGRGYFEESILGLTFKITPFSFFQTNSRGAEVLYRTAIDFLGDVKGKTVFDLYSGTGTIAQVLASSADHVTGIEIVPEAVQAARENAARNHLDNCTFIVGDVLKVLDEIGEKPDAIVLDPPRDGIHPKALPKIIRYGVENIVYISCKPSSLARDLAIFQQGGYHAERICCVDMFPQTVHVETVCLLSNRKPDTKIRIDVPVREEPGVPLVLSNKKHP